MKKLNPKSLRLQAGLTQREVSQMLNIQEKTVGGWEKGVIPRLTPSQAKRLCEAYGCSLEELIEAFEGN